MKYTKSCGHAQLDEVIDELVDLYFRGEITLDQLVVESALDESPSEILQDFFKDASGFAWAYARGRAQVEINTVYSMGGVDPVELGVETMAILYYG